MKARMLVMVWIMLVLAWLAACAPGIDAPATGTEEPVGLPNPASVYCEEQGGKLEMRNDEGGTYGVCIFDDDSECEEWAYFRGECAPGDNAAETDAAQLDAGLGNSATESPTKKSHRLETGAGEPGLTVSDVVRQ